MTIKQLLTRLVNDPSLIRTEETSVLEDSVEIAEQYYISNKLKQEFIQSGQLKNESPDMWNASLIDLANRTISEIHIGENGTISVMLMNA